jgi:outer membrane protein/adhesin transport system outer membrane protein
MVLNNKNRILLSLAFSAFIFSSQANAQINLDSEFKQVISSAKDRANLSLGAENVDFSQQEVKQVIQQKQLQQATEVSSGLKLPQSLANKPETDSTNNVESLSISAIENQPQAISQPALPLAKQQIEKPEYQPKTGTMEDLLSKAYGNNPALNSARAALKTLDEQYNQAISGYLPRLEYNYTTTQDKTTPLGGVEDTYNLTSDSLNLNQPLFRGGATYYSVKAAKDRLLSGRSELRNTEQQFLLDSLTAYIEVIFTEKVLDLAINNQSVLEEQLQATQDRFVIGDATRTDVSQSEARLANAKSNKVIAEGEFINAKANFKRFFEAEAMPNLKMPEILPNIPASLEEALIRAANNNPQVNQLSHLVKSRESEIGVRQSQLLPQVDLNGTVSNRESPVSNGTFDEENQTVGVNVRVPIYDAGITYSRTREARDRRDQTKQQLNDINSQVRSFVVQSWQQILTTAANIEATKASLAASEYALDGVRQEQKEGARTILDVLDAEQERFNAETNHARAIKDSVIAIYRLKFTLGELTPEELGLSVASYDSEQHYKNTRFKFIGL